LYDHKTTIIIIVVCHRESITGTVVVIIDYSEVSTGKVIVMSLGMPATMTSPSNTGPTPAGVPGNNNNYYYNY